MQFDVNLVRTVATVASFAIFVGILWWAYSKRRTHEFSEAANLPFEQD